MESSPRCLLLVDDEQNILFALKRELHEWARERSLEILTAASAREALTMLETRGSTTDLIVSDLKMPEMKGSDFLLKVRTTWPAIITILLTGYSETEEIVKAVSAGIYSYMLKPWDSAYLITEVQKAWEFGEMRKQNALNAQRMEDELKLAGELQKAILKPNLPATTGIEFRVSYKPVPGLYCGGDYYDVVSVGPDRYLMLIGDVSGHGVQAAFVTAILKAVIYPEYLRGVVGKTLSPADFLSWLNSRMQFEFRCASNMLITFFAGVLDVRNGSLLYSNAGQNHPCLITPSGIEELPVSGPAIGSGRSVLYIDKLVRVQQDNVIVLYTDGITEAGKGSKMLQVLQKVPSGPDFHARIFAEALKQSSATEFNDDVTLVTAKIML
jgi:sigma-B regulation protein RsbU (phosphoserine phosphatase)